MKTVLRLLTLVGLLVTTQAQHTDLARGKVQSDSLEATSFIDGLIKVATHFNVPLAVEWIKSPETLKPVRLDLRDANATATFDALVSSHPDYAWQLENGIIHVFPKSMVNDPRNPLNVRVDKVPSGSFTVFAADNFLFESVGPVVRADGPKSFELTLPVETEPQFDLKGENGPVRDFLNQIITTSKMKIWIATFPQTLPLTVKGYWETTPMYNTRAVKPEDQSFWIFLRWGDVPWKELESREP